MLNNDLLNNGDFWELVSLLLSSPGDYSVDSLSKRFNFDLKEILSISLFLRQMGCAIELEHRDESEDLYLKCPEPKSFKIEMSLLEWMTFQVHFPFLMEYNLAPYNQYLSDFLSRCERDMVEHDFFEAFEVLSSSMALGDKTEKVTEIEQHILEKNPLRIKLKNQDKNFFTYPYHLVFIHDKMSLIGEDISDKTLFTVPIEDIQKVKKIEEKKSPHFTYMEVQNFLDGIRIVSDNEQRLVLKITKPENEINFEPKYLYFRNACLIKSPRGDYIWSAYVESGDSLYHWLEDLWKCCEFEILEPTEIAEEFDRQLYQKLAAMKKAS
ncbi:MAG: WYL domain-containing protein [Halobacteriovoraceae bacterium]|nr:WYL domain-containing protein [Halobacteriovoraceae bacterium]MCB9094116.1 WYL domain-containing protein [Halobacteriovoraceae bacterium]